MEIGLIPYGYSLRDMFSKNALHSVFPTGFELLGTEGQRGSSSDIFVSTSGIWNISTGKWLSSFHKPKGQGLFLFCYFKATETIIVTICQVFTTHYALFYVVTSILTRFILSTVL